MKKILYLFSDTGGGHRAAANSLMNAVKRTKGDTIAQESIDVFAEGSAFLNFFAQLYSPVIKYAPWLWQFLWFSLNNKMGMFFLDMTSRPFIGKKLVKIFKDKAPDVIVSVHPLLNHISINAIKKIGKRIPFITVAMDPVDLHKTWVTPDADVITVGTDEAKKICMAQGMPENKIKVLGIPIDPRFSDPDDKIKRRQEFGLAIDKYTVLLMGGGEGAGSILDTVVELNKSNIDMQIIVISGRNEALKNKLENMSLRFGKKIFGFTNEVPSIMAASDMIITKGGPGAIFEALARDLPMIITSWLPGQEEGNVKFVERQDIGRVCTDPKKVPGVISELKNDKKVTENLKKYKKPHAVFDIVNLILGYLP